MPRWRPCPVIYEINAWVWLEELSRGHGRRITLADVPAEEWDRLGDMAIDAVWLMGVWERSADGAAIKRHDEALLEWARQRVPGFVLDDVVGSPYCVRGYVADSHLGGTAGLQQARTELAARGLKLLLDFVPNHVASDHPWVSEHPEYLMAGDEGDLAREPEAYTRLGGRIVAFGRERYSTWSDVLQLNPFHPGTRAAAVETLQQIATLCDGVRCDMAMLQVRSVVTDIWGTRAGPAPSGEYWPAAIDAVRAVHPEFLFVAEVYWDHEPELLQQGFDYCYDKRLYDRLVEGHAPGLRHHLRGGDQWYRERLVRFIENHDEPRAAEKIGPAAVRAAAVATATLPGATLWHEGQFEGRRVKVPVELGRRPPEPADEELGAFYRRLLGVAREVRRGEWRLCDIVGWPDNRSGMNIVAWQWRSDAGTFVVAVNLSEGWADGRVQVDPEDAAAADRVRLVDRMTGTPYEHDAASLRDEGLYVRLPPHGFQVLIRRW